MHPNKKDQAYFFFIPEQDSFAFRSQKLIWKTLERILTGIVMFVAFLPGLLSFVGLIWLFRSWGDLAIGISMFIMLGILILLAHVFDAYMALFDRFVFTVLTVPREQFALGKNKNVGFRLDAPGLYLLRPRSWIYFMGDEEEYSHFDPMSL